MITALGCGTEVNWKNLISSKSGINIIDSFKIDDLPSKVGGTISEDLINKSFNDKDKRKMDKFILYSLIATEEAINNSGWVVNSEIDAARSGVIIGSGFGGSVSALRLAQKGYRDAVLERGKRYNASDFPKTSCNIRKHLWFPRLFLYGIQCITLFRDLFVIFFLKCRFISL